MMSGLCLHRGLLLILIFFGFVFSKTAETLNCSAYGDVLVWKRPPEVDPVTIKWTYGEVGLVINFYKSTRVVMYVCTI